MTNEQDSNNHQQTLDDINQLQRQALAHTVPPRWFGMVIALLTGLLLGLTAADMREYTPLVLLATAVVVMVRSRQMKVNIQVKQPKVLMALAFASSAVVALYFSLIYAVQWAQSHWDASGLPIAAGIVFSSVIYLLSQIERQWHIAQLDKAGSDE